MPSHVTALFDANTNSQADKSCTLRIDSSTLPCNLVWHLEFEEGGRSVQFNKLSDDNPAVSFFGKDTTSDIITVDDVLVKSENKSEEFEAAGQCVLGKHTMGCQARLSDGRLVIGTIFWP